MNIQKALEHFKFKFSKSWKPTETDLKAFNTIIRFVKVQESELLDKNQLFGKLYIFFLDQQIKKYGTTVFNKIPQKQLSSILDKPLESFYVSFKNSFDDNIVNRIYNEKGIEIDRHPATLTESEKDDERIKIDKMTDADVKKILHNDYPIEEIEDNLNLMITESLRRFS